MLEVERLRAAPISRASFSDRLRSDRRLVRRRNRAREELQGLYNVARSHFGMPHIRVYLPVRKKISVLGEARSHAGNPGEIRVYPIHGLSDTAYSHWQPRDLRIDSPACVLETVIHESAHILEAHRYGFMGHERNFVTAYCEIERLFLEAGAMKAIDPLQRFSGCPAGSHAAAQFGRLPVRTCDRSVLPPPAMHGASDRPRSR
jgi:hypothetical protein